MHARKRNLDCLEKIVGRNMHVKGNSDEGQKEKRRAIEKAVVKGKHVIMNTMFIEIQTLKVLLMRFQMEMRNVLCIGNLKKGKLCDKVAKNLCCVLVLCGK